MADHPFAIVDASDEPAAAVASLRDLGAVVITNAVDLDHVAALRDVMLAELPHAASFPAALDIAGHVQHTPPPRAAHLHADVVANPAALAVARALVGEVQLGLYTGNTMLGGTTEQQPLHWDYAQLWPGEYGPTPPQALIVNIPLVDVAVENGALEVWPRTHHDMRSGGRAAHDLNVPDEWLDSYAPARVPLSPGSLLIRDGRLWHRGTTNTTNQPRPMVAVVYHAWWFRPLAIDFYADAEPVLRSFGLPVTARYREEFDHQAWPPDYRLVPKPL